MAEEIVLDPFALPARSAALTAAFSLLHMKDLGRSACVSRAWRDFVADPQLWKHANVTLAYGKVADPLLTLLAARAAGCLESLDASGDTIVHFSTLLAIVRANGDTLREVRLSAVNSLSPVSIRCLNWIDLGMPLSEYEPRRSHLRALLAAAPFLVVLAPETAFCSPATGAQMLRREAPYSPLKLTRLVVMCGNRGDADNFAAAVGELSSALPLHESLVALVLQCAPLSNPALLATFLGAVAESKLVEVHLQLCSLSDASLQALHQVLAGKPELSLVVNRRKVTAEDADEKMVSDDEFCGDNNDGDTYDYGSD